MTQEQEAKRRQELAGKTFGPQAFKSLLKPDQETIHSFLSSAQLREDEIDPLEESGKGVNPSDIPTRLCFQKIKS